MDDPIRYVMPKAIKETYNSMAEINFEKNEGGLAQVYEEDYKKNVMKITGPSKDDDVVKECEMLYKQLSYNLDVLSNLNYTPKPSFLPVKIVANVASIKLEDKTPIFMSDKKQLAPQELLKLKEVKMNTEEDMTSENKKTLRRQLKKNARTREKEKMRKKNIKQLEHKGETKHQSNLIKKGISKYKKNIKEKNQTSIKFTTSSQFFENLEKDKNKTKKAPTAEEAAPKKKNYKL